MQARHVFDTADLPLQGNIDADHRASDARHAKLEGSSQTSRGRRQRTSLKELSKASGRCPSCIVQVPSDRCGLGSITLALCRRSSEKAVLQIGSSQIYHYTSHALRHVNLIVMAARCLMYIYYPAPIWVSLDRSMIEPWLKSQFIPEQNGSVLGRHDVAAQ
jgi:hypothetical protein